MVKLIMKLHNIGEMHISSLFLSDFENNYINQYAYDFIFQPITFRI